MLVQSLTHFYLPIEQDNAGPSLRLEIKFPFSLTLLSIGVHPF